jgi:MoaA/NifB/PqqE/SkfB family radical SAM enzyme
LKPEIFIVETFLGCDLKCPECAIGGGFITRKEGRLDFDRFKIIADKIKPFCKDLHLYHSGEPLLNRDIFKIIKYASAFTKTNISTHGNTLTEEKAKKLIESGISVIIVSIDGMTQEIYERYRVGGDLKKVLKGLELLQHYNARAGSRVRINPQFIVAGYNNHEIDKFREYCKSLGLEPSLKPLNFKSKEFLFDKEKAKGCLAMKDGVFDILLDGSAVLCCQDYNAIKAFGNIYEQEVIDIWDSEEYKSCRQGVVSGNAPQFCIEWCMTYGTVKN